MTTDRKGRNVHLIDVYIPNDENITKRYSEKNNKYVSLIIPIK